MTRVSVIGLGKLGLPLAACLAHRSFEVVGVDIDAERVEAVNKRQSPLYEIGVQELLDTAGDRLRATTDLVGAIETTDVSFILVPTPSNSDGSLNADHVLSVSKIIGETARGRRGHLLTVLCSTVMPGTCDNLLRPVLGNHWFCYNPPFVALGEVVRGFTEPDWVLVGSDDMRAIGALGEVYNGLHLGNPTVAHMSFVNAEISKLALNTFLTTKITFANTIARLCERIPGANVDVITQAIGLDKRVSPQLLKGAVPFGGPCFPRDLRALEACRLDYGADEGGFPAAIGDLNRLMALDLAGLVLELSKEVSGCKIGVLGLTYKPGTDVTEKSFGMALWEHLCDSHAVVSTYDPAIDTDSGDSAEDLIAWADLVVVAVPWPEFQDIEFRPGQTVVDCWRFLDKGKVEANGARYVPLGVGLRDHERPEVPCEGA